MVSMDAFDAEYRRLGIDGEGIDESFQWDGTDGKVLMV